MSIVDKPLHLSEAHDGDPFNNCSYGTLVDSGYLQVDLPILDVNAFNRTT
jgi:hypothetical protein